MTDAPLPIASPRRPNLSRRRARRRAAERRFRWYGMAAIGFALLVLVVLIGGIVRTGYGAFLATEIGIDVAFEAETIDPAGTRAPATLSDANYRTVLRKALAGAFPQVTAQRDQQALMGMLSSSADFRLRGMVLDNPSVIGTTQRVWLKASADIDTLRKADDIAVATTAGAGALQLLADGATVTLRAGPGAFTGLFADLAARRPDAVTNGRATLGSHLPGYMVETADGGLLRLTSFTANEATGDILLAPEAAPAQWFTLIVSPPEGDRRIDDRELAWYRALDAQGRVRTVFNTTLFTSADSREPELAGVRGAVVGSLLTLVICLLLSFPLGVMAAVYLEEFAPKNRWTDLIEVNINNLAAVPSIVFGLLGLAVLLGFFGMPRSAPFAGGTVLALMTLPTIIIAARAALGAVPPSIREAAMGMGASPLQTVLHHVMPLALPGILTGTIIGMARALGETAPLLMIGMVAFIVDVPGGFTDPATVLPVQIYLWADAPERAFVEKTSAAILVLLAFLVVMNLAAVILRRRFERRW
ncbi:MAG: phosphate ABC transporter permease PstA [Alphaproteobacteria bacterium]|nr:phosphate ABC transporter permease PstA [Alphaproteobacteria bacterium]